MDLQRFQFWVVILKEGNEADWGVSKADFKKYCEGKDVEQWPARYMLAITGGQHTWTALKQIRKKDPEFFTNYPKHAVLHGQVFFPGGLLMYESVFTSAMREGKASMVEGSRVLKDEAGPKSFLQELLPEFESLTPGEWLAIPTLRKTVILLGKEHNMMGALMPEDTYWQKFYSARQLLRSKKKKGVPRALEANLYQSEADDVDKYQVEEELKTIFGVQDLALFMPILEWTKVPWAKFAQILKMDSLGSLSDQSKQKVKASKFVLKTFQSLAKLEDDDAIQLMEEVIAGDLTMAELKIRIHEMKVIYHFDLHNFK